MNSKITEKQAEILLAAVIIARSCAYLFSKICLNTMRPFFLLASRSLIAFLLLIILFRKKMSAIKKEELIAGGIIGALFYFVMAAELCGLKTTDSSVAALLENTAIVFVPFINASFIRKPPGVKSVFCCISALIGIGFITYNGVSVTLSYGEWLVLLAAVLYALTIVVTSKVSNNGDAINIGTVQVGVIGTLALISSFIFETISLPSNNSEIFSLMFLAIICTLFGFTLQPLAQSKCSTEKAGLMCALNPVTAVVLGVLILNEPFGIADIIGFILIIIAIIIYSKSK